MGRAALVLGGAANVWDDIKAARELFTPDVFVVVNDMISVWPERIDYAATLHPEKLEFWLKKRATNGFEKPKQIWSLRDFLPSSRTHIEAVTHVTEDWAGSSGLFAVKVALQNDCDRIVVCGVPMNKSFRHIVRKSEWSDANIFRNNWLKRRKQIADKVRSMSGWTMQHFGQPTPEWLRVPEFTHPR